MTTDKSKFRCPKQICWSLDSLRYRELTVPVSNKGKGHLHQNKENISLTMEQCILCFQEWCNLMKYKYRPDFIIGLLGLHDYLYIISFLYILANRYDKSLFTSNIKVFEDVILTSVTKHIYKRKYSNIFNCIFDVLYKIVYINTQIRPNKAL